MDVYRKAVELAAQGRPFALAIVVKASGSTPQKAGAKAIFEPTGAIWGTLGGGCLEAESRVRALRAIDEGKPIAFDLSLDEDYGWDDGLICGGRVRIFVDPRAADHSDAYAAALEALERRERGWLFTYFGVKGVGVSWLPESTFLSCVDDEILRQAIRSLPRGEVDWQANVRSILDSLESGQPLCDDVEARHDGRPAGEGFIEPVVPAPRLLIAGGGHIGQATARLGSFLGFEVTVVDDRPAFTDAKLYPEGVRTVCADIAETVGSFPIGPDTYVVIVTRGHRHDGEVLARCVSAPAAYLGMIGSKRKILLIRKQFIEQGIATEAEMDRVHSPLGLDIGSVTVPEIATSIAAELVAVRRKHQGVARPLAETVPRKDG